MKPRGIHDRDWISEIRKGDVLKSRRSGVLRIVRDVVHYPPTKTWVCLVILRCSWTKRCYTYVGREDIKERFRPVKANVSLRSKLDKEIEREIQKTAIEPIEIHCCDVRGVS